MSNCLYASSFEYTLCPQEFIYCTLADTVIRKAAFDQYPHEACRWIYEPRRQVNVMWKVSLPYGPLDRPCPLLRTCIEAREVAEGEFDGCIRPCVGSLSYYRAVASNGRVGVESYFEENFRGSKGVIAPNQPCLICDGQDSCESIRKFYFTKRHIFNILTIRFRVKESLREIHRESKWAASIRHLAIPIRPTGYDFTSEEFKNYIRKVENLKTLTIYISPWDVDPSIQDRLETKGITDFGSKDLQSKEVGKSWHLNVRYNGLILNYGGNKSLESQ